MSNVTITVSPSEKVTGRKGGPWYIIIYSSGKRHREPYPGWTKAQVEAEAAAMRARVDRGLEATEKDWPTFGEARDAYLADGTGRLKTTTSEDHHSILNGPPGERFAPMSLPEVTKSALRVWWHEEVEGKKHLNTGKNYLSALSAVFRFHNQTHRDEERIANPVLEFRAELSSERPATAQDRALQQTSADRRPIRSPKAIARLVAVAHERAAAEERDGRKARADEQVAAATDRDAVLVLLDTGIRVGELAGLRWPRVWWGNSPDDTSRHLHVQETKPRGKDSPITKSGRFRKVALPRRSRAILQARWIAAGRPETGLVFPLFHAKNFRRRFGTLCTKAEIGDYSPKHLRDTYASWLLSLGFPLSYVQGQLGHANASTTEKHYAEWIPEGYIEPERVRPGEVPGDVLARLVEIEARHIAQGGET